MPFDVLLLAIVGFVLVPQQTPRATIAVPLLVMLPPHVAEVCVIALAAVVDKTAGESVLPFRVKNRQGRIVADVLAGRNSSYRGTQGTSICQVFDATIAQTGVSEKTLNRIGDADYEKIYIYPNSHAGYYPGAKVLATKVLFRKSNGKLLGAQVLGEDAVAKRMDSFAMAIQMGCTIYDLEESELTYAPPYGSAKDPVNFAGMVAADILTGLMPIAHWNALGDGFLLDVRNPQEIEAEAVPDAVNIPLPQLRSRLTELPADKEILVICRSAQRAYFATRILLQNGFKARNISGGMMSRSHSIKD